MKEKMSAQSARVLLGSCLLYACCAGLGANCKGIFFAPVAEAFGVQVSDVTRANLYYGIAGTLLLPLCSKLFHRDYQKSLLSFLAVYAGSMIAMQWCNSLFMYCLLNALQGATGCFLTYYPIQYLINRSVSSYAGTAMGIVLMSSGVVSIVMNPVCNAVIAAYGWQAGYMLIGLLALVICIPAIVFFLRSQYFGIQKESGDAPKVDLSRVSVSKRKVVLFAALLTIPLGCFIALPQHCSNYAITIGMGASFGSLMVSAGMAGNLISKLLFGALNDRIGVWKTTGLGISSVILGCILLAASKNQGGLMAGAFLSGITPALVALQIPLASRAFLGNDAHEKCYSSICTVTAFAGSASHYLLALIYDNSGSYLMVFLVAACTFLECIAALALFRYHAKKTNSIEYVRRNCV